MLIENSTLNTDQFISMFDKKFRNFCTKSPLSLKYTIFPDKVILYDLSSSDIPVPHQFPFDFTKTEGENIKVIKEFLCEEIYPILTFVTRTKRPFSPQEQSALIDQGIPLEKAMSAYIEEESVSDYRIEKRLDDYNELILRNLETDQVSLWKLKYPIAIFLDEIFKNPEKASKSFSRNAEFKKVLVETPFDKKGEGLKA